MIAVVDEQKVIEDLLVRRISHRLSDYLLKIKIDADRLFKKMMTETFQDFLTDEDFSRVFGMDRDTFGSMAVWKKEKLKKSVGLF